MTSHTPHPINLSNQEISRYSRHLIMPEVGMEGQRKLKSAAVLLVGAGGLGAPLAMYLAAAGVGRIVVERLGVIGGLLALATAAAALSMRVGRIISRCHLSRPSAMRNPITPR